VKSKPGKIVVTGGAGFLGSHVVRLLLEKSYEVHVLDDFSNGKMLHLEGVKHHPGLTVQRGDITNRQDVVIAFEGCEAVIHLAVLDLRQSIKDPERVNDVIVNGTLNCLQQARRNQMQVFLNCSSSEVFGSAAYTPMDEKHPLNPETPYAAAKAAQDLYVFSFGRTYHLPWVTVRPFNMYGPNSHWQGFRGELIPKMIVRAMNRQPLVIFGDGEQTRDFIYVKDAADGIVATLENDVVRTQSINLCSSTETSIKTIALTICQYFQLDPAEFVQRQLERPGDVMRHFGDNSRMKELLGFIPPTPLQQGIVETIEWFKSLPYQPHELLATEVLRNWE
jgi:UDP-glucose 4-epimerase